MIFGAPRFFSSTRHHRTASQWLSAVLLGFLPGLHVAAAGAASGAPVKTEHVTAALVSEAAAVQPGKSVLIGLRLQHIPHWHTYWRNPGDSGLPTTLTWTAPAGADIGAIDWPAPKRLPLGPLVNYGYEGDLLLPMRLTAPADARPGSTLNLQANASWLVCRDICIPESATLNLELPVAEPGVTPDPTAYDELFERTAIRQAVPLQGWSASLQHSGAEMLLQLDRDGGTVATPDPVPMVQVFPYTEQLIEPARHELYRTPTGYAVRFSVVANATIPATFDAIAVLQSADGTPPPTLWSGGRPSAEFTASIKAVANIALPNGSVRIESGEPALADARGGIATTPEQFGGGAAPLGLLAALLLALVGGMVLNLMPCVFPVLSIKLLSLTQHGTDKRKLRTHAVAYSAGVTLSFVALAAMLLGLRAAGSAVGWGFQLQEPGVVFALALLFFAIGLNLMGAFEFGNLLPQGLASWRAKRPAADAFGAGILAVVAASPCTAPFMGAALGFALTQSAGIALTIFAALGIGMALPYAALVLLPGWRARLPRPGAWMLRLKQLLAFPIFATVVWLIWVLGLQAGINGAAKALLALVGLGFVVWLAGAIRSDAATRRAASSVAVVALAGLLIWSWPAELTPAQAAEGRSESAARDNLDPAQWQAYSDDRLKQQLADGRPVFVDFTAAWCVSCQVNKRLVLNTQGAKAAFEQAGVSLMRADWTRRDAEITAALARLGRNGVPVYVLHRPGKEPLLLPEILTLGLLRDALSSLQPQ